MPSTPRHPLPGLEAGSPLESSLRALLARLAETGDPRDARAVAGQLQQVPRRSQVRQNAGLLSFYDGKLRLWRLLAEEEPEGKSGDGEGEQRINGRPEKAVDGREPLP